MLPLPAATTTLTNTKPTADAVVAAFMPYGYFEIGVMIAAVLVIFLVYVFRDAISMLFHKTTSKFDSDNSK